MSNIFFSFPFYYYSSSIPIRENFPTLCLWYAESKKKLLLLLLATTTTPDALAITFGFYVNPSMDVPILYSHVIRNNRPTIRRIIIYIYNTFDIFTIRLMYNNIDKFFARIFITVIQQPQPQTTIATATTTTLLLNLKSS